MESIKKVIDVPIVLHGGSVTPVEQVQESISHGIRKLDICTDIMVETYVKTMKAKGFKYTCENLCGPS